MAKAQQLAINILRAAKKWRSARAALKLALDSKSASVGQKATAKNAYLSACTALEEAVDALDVLAHPPAAKRSNAKTFPWKEALGVGAGLVQLLDGIVNPQAAGGVGEAPQPPGTASKKKRPPAGTVNEDGSIEAEVMDE